MVPTLWPIVARPAASLRNFKSTCDRMIEHTYDDRTGTLLVTDGGKEVLRVDKLPADKVKGVLSGLVVNAGDGKAYGLFDTEFIEVSKPRDIVRVAIPVSGFCANPTCPFLGDVK